MLVGAVVEGGVRAGGEVGGAAGGRVQEADQREVSVGYCAHRDSPSFLPWQKKGRQKQKELSFEWSLCWIGLSALPPNNLTYFAAPTPRHFLTLCFSVSLCVSLSEHNMRLQVILRLVVMMLVAGIQLREDINGYNILGTPDTLT